VKEEGIRGCIAVVRFSQRILWAEDLSENISARSHPLNLVWPSPPKHHTPFSLSVHT
jgi:hypothetical protein